MRRIHCPSLPLLVWLVSLVAASASVDSASAQVARPLTLEEVHCDADRLAGLLERSTLTSPQVQKPIQLTWTFGSRAGDFAGIALTNQWQPPTVPFNSEKQLWFELDRDVMPLRRNPALNPLPTFTLARVASASDLRPADDPERLTVTVNPTSSEAPPSGSLLSIDNRAAGVAVSTKSGLGLRAISRDCHGDFSAADLHVFRVVSKLLRTFAFNCCGSSSESPQYLQRALLYRGAAVAFLPDGKTRTTYRIDALEDHGDTRLSVELEVDLAADGTLGRGAFRRLPACTSENQRDCSREGVEVDIVLVRPAPAGNGYPLGQSILVCNRLNDGSACPTEVVFDFADLLRGTDWARPR